MYQTESDVTVRPEPARLRALMRARVSRNVWCLGLTSLMTDASSEMITAVLPLYLVAHHGLSPLAFGTIDGLQQGVSAGVRWVSGLAGDRAGRHKEVAAVGYGMSAAVKLGWLFAGGMWSMSALLVGLDRTGKGIRTAPRDALISLSSPPSALGRAFGVHRALDATGALLGPLAAFAILAAAPGRFDVLFVLSFAAAVAGLGVLLLFVQNAVPEGAPGKLQSSVAGPTEPAGPKGPALRHPGPGHAGQFSDALALLRHRPFQLVVIASSTLALVTISDAFVYLALQAQFQFAANLLPLLYVVTSFVYLLLAVPVGHLADRAGRGIVFAGGHLVLVLTYAVLLGLSPIDGPTFWIAPVLLGVYYAATDGVLPAIASAHIQPGVRGSGLALLGTATSLSRLCASVIFGWFWTNVGRQQAVFVFATMLLIATPIAGYALLRLFRERSA